MYSSATKPITTEPTIAQASRRRVRGVTLIELAVVMTLLGIIAATAAVALRAPVIAYRDAQRRAEITDIADTALRRISRDVRRALPNSIRQNGNNLEMLLTKTGGRYRVQQSSTGQGDILEFAAPDGSFDTIGPMTAPTGQGVAANDVLVVFNLFADPGIPVSNAYNQAACGASDDTPNCNTAVIGSTGAGAITDETKINHAQRRFPFRSPANRFQVIENSPVTYACDNVGTNATTGDGTGVLRRHSGYPIALGHPAVPNTAPIIARYVSACQITYDGNALNQRLGLVAMHLQLRRAGEMVNLYHEVHVVNVP